MPGSLGKLRVVRIGDPMPQDRIERFAAHVKEAFGKLIESLELGSFDPPPVDRIEASLLTGALDQTFEGEHVLGVTDVDLVERDAEDFFPFMFGGKDHRNRVALVSTRRLVSERPGRRFERALKVALHEIGHNFGLEHHYAFVRAGGDGYCPMSKGDYNRYGERGYVRAVIDARGFRFCHECHTFMARYARAFA